MARIRTVKPEIFQDEDLAGVSESAFILAIGLLNHADDEGYFKAHPGLIRAAVFPIREPSVSIHGGLSELSSVGYIRLFMGPDGKQYGLITNFTKHQRINRPTPSKIKGLEQFTESSVSHHGGLTPGREQGKEQGKEKTHMSDSPSEPDPVGDDLQNRKPKHTPCDHQMVVEVYHQVLPEMRRVVESRWAGSARAKALQARWQESAPKHQTRKFWLWFFSAVRTNPHWMGQNARGWTADLGWLLERRNFDKVVEHGVSNAHSVTPELARQESRWGSAA